MKNGMRSLFLLVFVMALPRVEAQSNLLMNGSFETQGGHSSNPLPPWSYTGTLLLTAGGCQAADGQNAVGIVAGSLFQDIPTVPGQEYRLSLYVAGWAPDGPLPAIHNLSVRWDDQLVGVTSFNSTGKTFSNMGWTYVEFLVIPIDDLTRLAFSNPNAISNPNIPLLDNVRLSVIPEPSAGALVISAAAGLGFWFRRNSGKQRYIPRSASGPHSQHIDPPEAAGTTRKQP